MPKLQGNPAFEKAKQDTLDKAADQADLDQDPSRQVENAARARVENEEAHGLSADRTDTFTSRKPERQPLTWATLEDTDDKLNVTLFGREGSGKTTDVAAMANLGPILFINAEGGLKRAPLRRLGIKTESIRVWPDREKGQTLNFEDMERWAFQIAADLEDDPQSWAGVVIDSGTEVTAALLEQVTEKEMRRAAKRGSPREDRWQTDRGDWGKMSSQVRTLIRRFRDLPCHFAVTALERRDVDEDTGKVAYGPAVNPGLQSDLLGSPDLVLYCKADVPIGWTPEELAAVAGDDDLDPIEFRALTRPKGKFRAKDRFGVFPQVLVNPRFDKLVAYVNGELTQEDDPDQRGVLAAKQGAGDAGTNEKGPEEGPPSETGAEPKTGE